MRASSQKATVWALPRPLGRHLELFLRGKHPGGDDDGVDPAESFLGGVERRGEGLGGREIAGGGPHRPGLPATADLEIPGAFLEIVARSPEEKKTVSPLGHEPCEGASHALGGT